MNHNRVNVKADIRRDRKTGDVYVIDGSGKEIFRRPYNPQTVEIAHSIYMSAKYGEDAFPEE
jgi:hypothetical protein